MKRRKQIDRSPAQSADQRDLWVPRGRWPHRLAIVLCWTVFPLISVGGLVTTYDAGMAVPDWPSTYGYNLLLYPWSTWFFGPWDLFLEHGHRLLGALAGMINIAFVVAVFRGTGDKRLRVAAGAGLAMIIAQGSLGGARVLLDERELAMVHGCAGPAFFAYCTALAAITSPLWTDRSRPRVHPRAKNCHQLTALTVALVYLQLVLGAQLRHIPVTAWRLVFNFSLIWHLVNALLVAVVIALVGLTLGRMRDEAALRWPALLLVGLLLVQLVLGPATWIVTFGWHYWFAGYRFAAAYLIRANSLLQTTTVTLHMAIGSLILATAVLLFLRSRRLLRWETVAISSRNLPARNQA